MEDHFQTLNDLALFSAYRVVIPQFQLYSQLKKKNKKSGNSASHNDRFIQSRLGTLVSLVLIQTLRNLRQGPIK